MFNLCQWHLKSSTATETFLFFFFFFVDLQLYKGPSLPNLFKKSKDSDLDGSSTGPEEETSFGSEYSGGKRVRDRLLIGARPVPRNAASFLLPERETQKRRKTNIFFFFLNNLLRAATAAPAPSLPSLTACPESWSSA